MSKGEIQYFLTFAAGIAAFWLGGQAVAHLGFPHDRLLAQTLARATILAVYGAGLALLLTFTLGAQRSLKGIVIATVSIMALALLVAISLVHVTAGHIHTQVELGLFTLVYYVIYGLLYVLGGVIARRFSRA
jgi:hypothetical protein